ncbi:MAG: MotA/TolQ/ExbB proton channel family protein [Cyanobacteria bacterium P01_G01_bin.67]
MSIGNLWTAGGIVSIPLLGFSLLAIALIIERIIFWWRVKQKQRRIVKEVLSLYRSDRFAAIAKLKQNAQLPIARIFLEAMELEQPTPDEFRLALDSAVQAEIPVLRRFNTWFQTIITASPLLGLLGTILGLIQSFSSLDMGNVASTNASGVTGGLSEALISTVMGLVVAIFTLLFANAFRGLYLRELAFIQEYGGQLELLNRRFHQQSGKLRPSTAANLSRR